MSRLAKTLDEARALYEAGRYLLAADKAIEAERAFGEVSGGKNKPLRADKRAELILALVLQLKCYNRGQYLPEAIAVRKRLTTFSKYLDVEALIEFACLHTLLGRPEKSLKLLQTVSGGMDGAHAYFPVIETELGLIHEQQGNRTEALRHYKKVIDASLRLNNIDQNYLRAFNRASNVDRLSEREILHLECMYQVRQNTRLGASILFILAKNARKRQDISREIDLLRLANEQAEKVDKAAGILWDEKREQERTQNIKTVFSSASPKWLPIQDIVSTKAKQYYPIFILAMPRSGTTLLEQILGAHSDVENAGESKGFNAALNRAFYANAKGSSAMYTSLFERVKSFSALQLRDIADYYIDYQKSIVDVDVATDKQLANVMWVGLISNLFPMARFIYLVRNPLDNCVSLLQHDFQEAPYSTSAGKAVREYYEYDTKMRYWREMFPGRIHTVRYSELIDNPEPVLRRLFEFLELEWQGGILEYHKRKNSVRTPSLQAVRSGINSGSENKWLRYREMLGEAVDCVEAHLHQPN